MYVKEHDRRARVRADRNSIAAGRNVTIHAGAHVVLGDHHEYSHRCAHCRHVVPSVSRARYQQLLCCMVGMLVGLYVSVLMSMDPHDIVAECILCGLWGYVFLQPAWAWAEARARRRARAMPPDTGL